MDVGPPKVRRRITKGTDIYNVTIIVDSAGYSTLENFFDNTLAGGVKQFEFDHPITGNTEIYRMQEPRYTPVGSEFLASMVWEKLP